MNNQEASTIEAWRAQTANIQKGYHGMWQFQFKEQAVAERFRDWCHQQTHLHTIGIRKASVKKEDRVFVVRLTQAQVDRLATPAQAPAQTQAPPPAQSNTTKSNTENIHKIEVFQKLFSCLRNMAMKTSSRKTTITFHFSKEEDANLFQAISSIRDLGLSLNNEKDASLANNQVILKKTPITIALDAILKLLKHDTKPWFSIRAKLLEAGGDFILALIMFLYQAPEYRVSVAFDYIIETIGAGKLIHLLSFPQCDEETQVAFLSCEQHSIPLFHMLKRKPGISPLQQIKMSKTCETRLLKNPSIYKLLVEQERNAAVHYVFCSDLPGYDILLANKQLLSLVYYNHNAILRARRQFGNEKTLALISQASETPYSLIETSFNHPELIAQEIDEMLCEAPPDQQFDFVLNTDLLRFVLRFLNESEGKKLFQKIFELFTKPKQILILSSGTSPSLLTIAKEIHTILDTFSDEDIFELFFISNGKICQKPLFSEINDPKLEWLYEKCWDCIPFDKTETLKTLCEQTTLLKSLVLALKKSDKARSLLQKMLQVGSIKDLTRAADQDRSLVFQKLIRRGLIAEAGEFLADASTPEAVNILVSRKKRGDKTNLDSYINTRLSMGLGLYSKLRQTFKTPTDRIISIVESASDETLTQLLNNSSFPNYNLGQHNFIKILELIANRPSSIILRALTNILSRPNLLLNDEQDIDILASKLTDQEILDSALNIPAFNPCNPSFLYSLYYRRKLLSKFSDIQIYYRFLYRIFNTSNLNHARRFLKTVDKKTLCAYLKDAEIRSNLMMDAMSNQPSDTVETLWQHLPTENAFESLNTEHVALLAILHPEFFYNHILKPLFEQQNSRKLIKLLNTQYQANTVFSSLIQSLTIAQFEGLIAHIPKNELSQLFHKKNDELTLIAEHQSSRAFISVLDKAASSVLSKTRLNNLLVETAYALSSKALERLLSEISPKKLKQNVTQAWLRTVMCTHNTRVFEKIYNLMEKRFTWGFSEREDEALARHYCHNPKLIRKFSPVGDTKCCLDMITHCLYSPKVEKYASAVRYLLRRLRHQQPDVENENLVASMLKRIQRTQFKDQQQHEKIRRRLKQPIFKRYLEMPAAQPQSPDEDIRQLIAENKALIKTFSRNRGAVFCKQLANYEFRGAQLREPATGSRKHVLGEGITVDYRSYKRGKQHKHTKKMSTTQLSRRLHTRPFGGIAGRYDSGVLLDKGYCVIKAMLTEDRNTYLHYWIGSQGATAHKLTRSGIRPRQYHIRDEHGPFTNEVNHRTRTNELLTKVSRDAVRAIFVQSNEEVSEIAETQKKLERIVGRSLPVYHYSHTGRFWRLVKPATPEAAPVTAPSA